MKKTILDKVVFHLIEKLPDYCSLDHLGQLQKIWTPNRVVYEHTAKGKTLVKVGVIHDPFFRRYGATVETHYEPATGKFWNHDPKFEDLLRSGKWRDLPVFDVSNFEVRD